MPIVAPTAPIHAGLFSKGIALIIRTIPPFINPAAPTPEIARPKMKAIEFGAEPHTADPISKTTMSER
jgi:hypothetical protein